MWRKKSFGKILVESNLYNATEKRFFRALHANHRKSIKLCNSQLKNHFSSLKQLNLWEMKSLKMCIGFCTEKMAYRCYGCYKTRKES